MNLSVGIVGLPNVGKSTLFNALLKKQQALAANYPFATIEPNVGIVPVPDERLEKLAIIVGGGDPHASLRKAQDDNIVLPPIKPATVEFKDIAGLVKGASEGAGLGNKFLSHIRETNIICHVVRAFADPDIVKEGSVDPKSDFEMINMELMLADLATLEKVNTRKHESKLKDYEGFITRVKDSLQKGIPVRSMQLTDDEQVEIRNLSLLSTKPELIVLNVSEDQYNPSSIERITKEYNKILNPSNALALQDKQASPDLIGIQDDKGNIVVVCAKIESELSELSEEDQKQYLADLGLQQSGLERVIKKAYETLGLISFLTAGEKEVRAWTIRKGMNAVEAAGEIHTDFMKKFIKAEVVSFADFVNPYGDGPASTRGGEPTRGGWKGSRTAGKARLEGKEYIMQDGDVVEFKIGA